MTASGPWDLGDTIRLTTPTVTDASGAAVNCTTMQLTVTLPDGSTATPAVTNPPATTGNYLVDYTAVQAGHHRVRWVGTNPAYAYTDVFDVLAADPRFIISLADAREALRKTAGATADDAELRLYLAAVTPIVEDIAGPQVVETLTYTAHGGRSSILLPTQVVSVQSVTENGVALTASQDYVVDLAAGIIYRGTTLQPYSFIAGHDNIVVNYTAAAGVIAQNVRLAARIILKHLWTADNTGTGRPGLNTAQASSADVIVTPGGYAVPRRAAELLSAAQNVNLPGFA